jgi:hypothetical protein
VDAQDLYNYQMSLQELEKMRVDGKWVDADGKAAEGQFVRPPRGHLVLVFVHL